MSPSAVRTYKSLVTYMSLVTSAAMQETQVQPLGSGRSLGEGNGNLCQHSYLEKP